MIRNYTELGYKTTEVSQNVFGSRYGLIRNSDIGTGSDKVSIKIWRTQAYDLLVEQRPIYQMQGISKKWDEPESFGGRGMEPVWGTDS